MVSGTLLTRHRIEGNTIIIATCIPVLRPLVDLVFGREFLGDSQKGRPHHSNSRGSRGTGSQPPSIRLSSRHHQDDGARSSIENSSSSDNGKFDPTMLSECDKVCNSRENILPLQEAGGGEMDTGIIRTQSVVISYSRSSGQHDRDMV